jgi:hypothetical protein
MPAIKLGGGSSVTLRDVHIRGFDVGVQGDPGSSVQAEGVSFDNVRQPWDLAGEAPSQISGTRIANDPKAVQAPNKTTIGWRRPAGPPLPAFCPRCKAIFPSRNYNIGSSKFYSRDNEETCPHCRFEHAKLSDGLFDLTAEAVSILQGPDITFATLAALAAIAQSTTENRITPEQAVARFTKADPRIGTLFNRALSLGPTAVSYLSAAVGIAALIYAHVGTLAGLESRDLAREQTALARAQTEMAQEALRIQKQPSSSDHALEKVVEGLKELKFVLESQADIQREAIGRLKALPSPPTVENREPIEMPDRDNE